MKYMICGAGKSELESNSKRNDMNNGDSQGKSNYSIRILVFGRQMLLESRRAFDLNGKMQKISLLSLPNKFIKLSYEITNNIN